MSGENQFGRTGGFKGLGFPKDKPLPENYAGCLYLKGLNYRNYDLSGEQLFTLMESILTSLDATLCSSPIFSERDLAPKRVFDDHFIENFSLLRSNLTDPAHSIPRPMSTASTRGGPTNFPP
jgi:hypothetical protein